MPKRAVGAVTHYSNLLVSSSVSPKLVKTTSESQLSAATANEVFIVESDDAAPLHNSN